MKNLIINVMKVSSCYPKSFHSLGIYYLYFHIFSEDNFIYNINVIITWLILKDRIVSSLPLFLEERTIKIIIQLISKE